MTVFPLPAPVLYLLECLQTAIIICTTPEGSLFRIAYSLWLVFTTYQYHLKSNELCGDCIQKLYINLFSFVHTIHCINLLLIIGLDGSTVAYRKQPNDHAGILSRVWSAFEMTFNPRGINTPWQIKGLPQSSFFEGKPTRGRFLIRQLCIFAWQYLVLDVLISIAHEYWGGQAISAEGKEMAYLDTPDGPLSLQTTIQMVASFFVTRLALDLIHRSMSIVSVGTCLSTPTDWPPMFGSMWDSYTLRLFWGKYWHQMLRWPFTTICSFTAHNIIRLPQPSKYRRYMTFVLVFTLSALLHQYGSHSMGISLKESNAFVFFWLTALGGIVEQVVQSSLREKSTGGTSRQGKGIVLWKRIVGYLWVLAWLGPSGSYFMYPTVSMAIVNRSVGVPYSVVENFGLQSAGTLLGVGALILKILFKTNL